MLDYVLIYGKRLWLPTLEFWEMAGTDRESYEFDECWEGIQ